LDDKMIVAAILTVAVTSGMSERRPDAVVAFYKQVLAELEKQDLFDGSDEEAARRP
jgi:hypothetical protein